MKIRTQISTFQQGGAMPAPVEQEQQGNPIEELAVVAQQALQEQNCELAMGVCDAFLQMVSQATQGEPAPQGEPVYAKGGKLIKRR